MAKLKISDLNFKHWFLHGNKNSTPGYTRLLDIRTVLDLSIGAVVTIFVSIPLQEASTSILLPLTGVLIGVCASWAAPAQEVLSSQKMIPFLKSHKGGPCEYFLILQLVVFVMLFAIVLWGGAGIGLFESLNSPELNGKKAIYHIISIFLYGILSLALRTCWEAVLFTHYVMCAKLQVLDTNNKANKTYKNFPRKKSMKK